MGSAAVPPEKLGNYLRDFRKLLERFGYEGDLYGHFGQGCIHTRIDFHLETHEGIKQFRSFLESAADLVLSYGGSLSGEHGDGQSRAWLLPKMFGPELIEAFREFKSIWDPEWRMNPGKIVDAYDVTENLRIGTDYRPADVTTHFHWPKDQGSFPRAILRCVGVGECRKTGHETMCPSYRVTMEEKHSTRGRARLLWEMLQGRVITDGWKSEEVKESLDLCLACKGCKGECPVTVDMATYKAEFLSHYYARRLRPRGEANAANAPASRARRHSTMWLEYRPSRRSSAPFWPSTAASYAMFDDFGSRTTSISGSPIDATCASSSARRTPWMLIRS